MGLQLAVESLKAKRTQESPKTTSTPQSASASKRVTPRSRKTIREDGGENTTSTPKTRKTVIPGNEEAKKKTAAVMRREMTKMEVERVKAAIVDKMNVKRNIIEVPFDLVKAHDNLRPLNSGYADELKMDLPKMQDYELILEAHRIKAADGSATEFYGVHDGAHRLEAMRRHNQEAHNGASNDDPFNVVKLAYHPDEHELAKFMSLRMTKKELTAIEKTIIIFDFIHSKVARLFDKAGATIMWHKAHDPQRKLLAELRSHPISDFDGLNPPEGIDEDNFGEEREEEEKEDEAPPARKESTEDEIGTDEDLYSSGDD